jgi:hypothetical protein
MREKKFIDGCGGKELQNRYIFGTGMKRQRWTPNIMGCLLDQSHRLSDMTDEQ